MVAVLALLSRVSIAQPEADATGSEDREARSGFPVARIDVFGSIAGTVVRPTADGSASLDEPVIDADIVLTRPGAVAYTTQTSTLGAYRLENVPTGKYSLRVDLAGATAYATPVTIAANQTTSTDVRLQRRPPDDSEIENIMVMGRSETDKKRESAEAVQVISTQVAQQQSADLGEVLARTSGIGVRRSGGLGSGTRIAVNGLTDDQIRFFIDGIPLDFAGYPFGIANVPVNFVQRIDIYRGVVPVRFGADALGGAINLITTQDVDGTEAVASYQAGSFNTHRITAAAKHLDEDTGFFSRLEGFYDDAANNYEIDVEVADERGRLSPARVERFHDEYRATGGNLQIGLVDKSWADRLILRGFVTDSVDELQHNVVMTVPYGEVNSRVFSAGGTLRYNHTFENYISLEVVAGYSHVATEFEDVGQCVYDWFGNCIRERRVPGEIDGRPRDQIIWDNNAYGRIQLEWSPFREHSLRLALSPTFTTRTGDERIQADPDARDPLTAQRDLLTLVSGIEYQADVLQDRLQNILFFKSYFQVARSEEPLPGNIFTERNRNTHRVGVGNTMRYRFYDWMYMKASYEWATRLPTPNEVFGNGVLIVPNLELEPETSHNVNLGMTIDARSTGYGDFRGDLNFFLRETDRLIVLLGNDRVFSFQNVFGARSLGGEASAGWTSRGGHFAIDGNTTYVDFRNVSDGGTFGDFEGDRIPNRPYFFANGQATAKAFELLVNDDELSLFWNTRFVLEFFRSWESVGIQEFKQTIPTQVAHTVGLTYLLRQDFYSMSLTAEMQNLTDESLFDFFGVQRPGRAFLLKLVAEI